MIDHTAAIEVRQLWQAHSMKWVLKDVTFEVRPGELAVLTGVNGVGKTTLLATIAGATSAARGDVSVNGFMRRQTYEAELAARRSSMFLPSDVFIPPEITVLGYLEACASLFCSDQQHAADRIEELLKLFALTGSERQSVTSLSDGQRKKLGLFSVLLAERPVLLLDEPFSGGLDPAGILAVKRILRARADSGQTILMTTPVIDLVAEVSDRLLVLRGGSLVHDLTRQEMLTMTGPKDSLAESLENLVFPEIHRRLDEYLQPASGSGNNT